MLHSLKPEHFVIPHELQALRECPECNGQFRYGNGFMFLAHYRVTATGEIQQGLACFCSTVRRQRQRYRFIGLRKGGFPAHRNS